MKKKYLRIIRMAILYSALSICLQCIFLQFLVAGDLLSQSAKSVRQVYLEVGFEEARLSKVFQKIEAVTDYKFVFDKKDSFLNERFSSAKKSRSVENLLLAVAKHASLRFHQVNNSISVTHHKDKNDDAPLKVEITADINVSGKITDEKGQGLPGATIVLKGTTIGATTDVEGNYKLTVPEDGVLIISYVGYATVEVSVAGRSVLDVQMDVDLDLLDEVIVVGFGTQKSRKVVSSVAQVSGEQLQVDKRPVTSIQSALIGAIPGLRGLNSNGRPGATPNFSIRGPKTLNSSNVLVIIDGFEGSLTDLDPQTVEKVSVLKDAAAVAVYGARGANGVILVTTKNTKRNEALSLSYSYNLSTQSPRSLPGTLNSIELMEFENFAATGDPTGAGAPAPPYSLQEQDLARSGFYPETVWPEELYKSGANQQSHNLAIEGGTAKTGYLINASYLNQKGLIIGSDDFKRINLRLKIDTDINDWLTVGTNTLITNRINNQTPDAGGGGLLGSPFFPVKTKDGLWVDKGGTGVPNPIAEGASGSFIKTDRNALNLQLYAQLKPLKGLKIEERISYLRSNVNTRDWTNVYDYVRLERSDTASYTDPDSPKREFVPGVSDARKLILTSSLAYSIKTLTTANYQLDKGSHHVGVLLGFQSEQGESEGFRTGRLGFFLDNLVDLQLGQNIAPVSDPDPNKSGSDPLGNSSFRAGNARTLSFFGRLNYDFQGRYIAEVTFRRDGSSNFLENNKWGFFPAIALGWNIAEEPFLSSYEIVDKFKLRTSYGTSGDDSGVGRRVTQLVSLDVTGYPIGGEIQPRIFLGSLASSNLTWETSTTFNTGLDFSLWQGKLQLNADYFITNREDILDEVTTPTEFGFGKVPANLYSVKSWGWELELIHENKIGNVNYWFSAFTTNYDNEITDLAGREQPDFAVGQSLDNWFGFETDGFFDNQAEIDAHVSSDGTTVIDQSDVGGAYIGGYKFIDQLTVDTDGDGIPDAGDGIINGDDRVILERNSATNFNLGINLGAGYKGFSLSARFYGVLSRNQWWERANAHEPFLGGGATAFDYQLNYWREDNPNAFFPEPQGNGIQGYASNVSHLIFDNEFIKLQNVTLSYAFDQTLLEKLGFIKKLSLVVSMENIGVVWTNSPAHEFGWDPELGVGAVNYPLPFTTSFGVNVKF